VAQVPWGWETFFPAFFGSKGMRRTAAPPHLRNKGGWQEHGQGHLQQTKKSWGKTKCPGTLNQGACKKVKEKQNPRHQTASDCGNQGNRVAKKKNQNQDAKSKDPLPDCS